MKTYKWQQWMPIEKLFLLKNIVLIFIDDFAYNTMGATSGVGTVYPYGAPELFFFIVL